LKNIKRLNHFLHNNLLKLMLCAYATAAVFPSLGISIKNVELGRLSWFSEKELILSLPLWMLSFLLFNAGFSVRMSHLKKVVLVPGPLLVGLVSKTLVPLIFTIVFALFGRYFWHNSGEIQIILVGIAVVAAMPIAGSSTAWVQTSGGNIALILGLVVFSTVLSPLISPIVFHLIGNFTTGEYSESLRGMGREGASGFLIISVVLPSILGMICRALIGDEKHMRIAPILGALNIIDLLLLNYSNASVSLPQVVQNWDLEFIILIGVTMGFLCILGFYAGWILPRFLRISQSERIALTYGLGMNNNGTGLVLVSSVLGSLPLVMVPIIFYNLGQQIVAGFFIRRIDRMRNLARSV